MKPVAIPKTARFEADTSRLKLSRYVRPFKPSKHAAQKVKRPEVPTRRKCRK